LVQNVQLADKQVIAAAVIDAVVDLRRQIPSQPLQEQQ
jgi:hypothetical protein